MLLPPLLFVVLGATFFWRARGDDLASSFVGCRVLATQQDQVLYSHDPVNFAGIAEQDTVWPRLAEEGGYYGWLHPYVQTPLWAWALRPVCMRMPWLPFLHLFLLLSLMSTAALIYLTARFWTPALYRPLEISLVLLLLAFSEPFLYAMMLVQTHALLLLLAFAGLLLAERGRPVLAGLAVAIAAAVKITPAFLLLYWIASRRWRASLSLLLWSALLVAGTRVVAGAALFHAYLESMQRVSRVLLVSENNQSLAAWWMGHFFQPDEVFDVNAFPLPAAVRFVSTAILGLTALAGGWLDNTAERRRGIAWSEAGNKARFGAAMTLVASTVFAPIAWTHYFIVLAIPLMLLAQTAGATRSRVGKALLWSSVVVCSALLFRPLAPDVIRMDLSDWAVLRGEFLAGLLCMGGLLAAAVSERTAMRQLPA